jgi:hypothetical protein
MENQKTRTQAEIGLWAKDTFGLKSALRQSTIGGIIKEAPALYSSLDKGLSPKRKSSKGGHFPELEKDIERFVIDMTVQNGYINRDIIKRYAEHIASTQHKMQPSDIPKFSEGWLTRSMARIGVKSRVIRGEANSVDMTSALLQDKISNIKHILIDNKYSPDDIMNFDETGLYFQMPPHTTISKQPMAGLRKSKKRLTVGLLCNATGTYKGHPIVIGTAAKPSCFDNEKRSK